MSLLATDNDGIYFGSFDKGIFHYNDKDYTNLTIKDGLSANLLIVFCKERMEPFG